MSVTAIVFLIAKIILAILVIAIVLWWIAQIAGGVQDYLLTHKRAKRTFAIISRVALYLLLAIIIVWFPLYIVSIR